MNKSLGLAFVLLLFLLRRLRKGRQLGDIGGGVLRETRMAVAQQLLASGAANVSQAAEAAGYASRSQFARAFREAYGMELRAASRA